MFSSTISGSSAAISTSSHDSSWATHAEYQQLRGIAEFAQRRMYDATKVHDLAAAIEWAKVEMVARKRQLDTDLDHPDQGRIPPSRVHLVNEFDEYYAYASAYLIEHFGVDEREPIMRPELIVRDFLASVPVAVQDFLYLAHQEINGTRRQTLYTIQMIRRRIKLIKSLAKYIKDEKVLQGIRPWLDALEASKVKK